MPPHSESLCLWSAIKPLSQPTSHMSVGPWAGTITPNFRGPVPLLTLHCDPPQSYGEPVGVSEEKHSNVLVQRANKACFLLFCLLHISMATTMDLKQVLAMKRAILDKQNRQWRRSFSILLLSVVDLLCGSLQGMSVLDLLHLCKTLFLLGNIWTTYTKLSEHQQEWRTGCNWLTKLY